MTGRPPRFLWPFVAVVYVLLLAPLVVVITVSFGSTSTFDFPPKGLSFRWYQAFFASEMFVRSFFRVSQVVGLCDGARRHDRRHAVGDRARAPAVPRPSTNAFTACPPRDFLSLQQLGAATASSRPRLPRHLSQGRASQLLRTCKVDRLRYLQ